MALGVDTIPKSKPDRTHAIRFEVQEKEREMLESLLATYQVKTGASFFGGLVDSVSKMDLPTLYALVTILEVLTGREILPGTPNDIMGLLDDLRGFLKEFDLLDWYNEEVAGDLGEVQQAAIDPERQEAMIDIYTADPVDAENVETVADIYAASYGTEVPEPEPEEVIIPEESEDDPLAGVGSINPFKKRRRFR